MGNLKETFKAKFINKKEKTKEIEEKKNQEILEITENAEKTLELLNIEIGKRKQLELKISSLEEKIKGLKTLGIVAVIIALVSVILSILGIFIF